MRILECSSKGDKRFSAFYAKIHFEEYYDSIENFYQSCKCFGDECGLTWREVKGKTPTHIKVAGVEMSVKYLTPFYKAMWLIYLDNHPNLIAHAAQFDEYNDIFKGKSINCQADVIRQYMKNGRESLAIEAQTFWNEYNKLKEV